MSTPPIGDNPEAETRPGADLLDADALELEVGQVRIVEKSATGAEQDRNDVDAELVDQAGAQELRMTLSRLAMVAKALRLLADQLETKKMATARRLGWSWEQIVDALGVSRQIADKKHRRTW